MRKYIKVKSISRSMFLAAVFFVSIFISLQVALSISEKYFFDRLYYDKSSQYGYADNYLGIVYGREKNRVIFSRLSDLISLIKLSHNQAVPNKVLGIKDSGLYNIAIIGDSFVYGVGVKENETFSKILEKKLNQIRKVKVYNFGLPGSNIIDNYSVFLLAEKYLDIDLYIIGFVEDDLLYFGFHKRYPGEEQVYNDLKSLCPGKVFEYNPEKGKAWDEVIIEGIYPSFSDDYTNICILSKIIQRIITKSPIFFNLNVTKIPPNIDSLINYTEHVRKKTLSILKYTEVIRKYGGIIVDPFDDKDFQYTQVSEREGHASRETHRLQAESLFEEIMNNPTHKFLR